jgi:deaminated glutathione amidase
MSRHIVQAWFVRVTLQRLLPAVAIAVLLAVPSHAAQRQPAAESSGRLKLATCQFPISADIAQNARWIRCHIARAAQEHADLVHFPETALSGYAGSDYETLDSLDWSLLRRETESILALAKQRGVWVVLGSTHRLSPGHKPHNSLYVISPEGRIVDRYDKRFCTVDDLRHYSPGDHFCTFDVKGVKCGLLICHDYRYPELYREYARRGVRLVLHSFYNSGKTDESVRCKLAEEYARVYATMNHLFVSYTNTSRRWSWPSCFVTPDGRVAATLPRNEASVTVNEVDLSREFDDPSGAFRDSALRGQLHSGACVDDERSRDRTCR